MLEKLREVVETLKDYKLTHHKPVTQDIEKAYTTLLDLANSVLQAEEVLNIRTIITKYGQLTSKYPDKKHLLPGDDTFISASQYNDLTKEITTALTVYLAKREAELQERLEGMDKFINEWLSKEHGFQYEGILARKLATALRQHLKGI